MNWLKRLKAPKTVEVYKDAEGKYRWRAVAKNGKVIAASEQGYSTKRYALSKAERYADAYGYSSVTFVE